MPNAAAHPKLPARDPVVQDRHMTIPLPTERMLYCTNGFVQLKLATTLLTTRLTKEKTAMVEGINDALNLVIPWETALLELNRYIV